MGFNSAFKGLILIRGYVLIVIIKNLVFGNVRFFSACWYMKNREEESVREKIVTAILR